MSVDVRPFPELVDAERAGPDPPYDHFDYVGTRLRAPKEPLVIIPSTLTELTGPAYGESTVDPRDADLTRQHAGQPLGERMVLSGRVLGSDGKPLRGQLVEIWQANAAGRYVHGRDDHPAPLDPNFTGAGRVITDAEGRYSFVSVKPGAYPWKNHPNAWRPAHIHFSIFGTNFMSRLVTQMYFPNDPLFPYDPIMLSVPDAHARDRMVTAFDLSLTQPLWALGYRFDIVLRGANATPFEART